MEQATRKGPKPKPENEKGKTVAAHVDATLFKEIEIVRFTRNRKASAIIAEAIRIGLPEVEKKYNATRELPAGWNGVDPLPK